jgi:hypothetical protein
MRSKFKPYSQIHLFSLTKSPNSQFHCLDNYTFCLFCISFSFYPLSITRTANNKLSHKYAVAQCISVLTTSFPYSLWLIFHSAPKLRIYIFGKFYVHDWVRTYVNCVYLEISECTDCDFSTDCISYVVKRFSFRVWKLILSFIEVKWLRIIIR